MKFDAARASAIFEKLGDPAFTGPNGEDRIADFVAGELERMGWKVERRKWQGSRVPQRVGPWIGWLGYGALITVSFCVILEGNLLLQSLAILATFFLRYSAGSSACSPIRSGQAGGLRTLEKAPVVIASEARDSSPPVRVIVPGGSRRT